VQNELGSAFLEPIYQEALALEFMKRKIPFSKETKLDVHYKDSVLQKKYYADFLCYGAIIVELKVCKNLAPEHTAQVLNYLSALKLNLALLINFGAPKLQWKRVILGNTHSSSTG
jgi:GxxExxY protein